MNKRRQIEKFISNSIKQESESINEIELDNIIAQMTTDDITTFWMYYVADRAFRQAEVNVPQWRTKDQERYFLDTSRSLYFHPKEKDANGKYIIVREDLINHIKNHLKVIIEREIQKNIIWRKRPFIKKLPFYFGILFLIVGLLYFLVTVISIFIKK